ncbi:cytochrome c oxidase assembly protein [Methylobacterium sp. WL30]|jgi:cytochrome c oxidase assembly protein subunit 11|uniref:cytochrome c oxidase assembly protein n=1 Tax=unclassified Methylobacterium TaxID=2615210 RepID=UPI0011CB2A5D|nr:MULTISPECIES: cytochrome c oxidase assembly protein [unclassified Methylobacterium]TXN38563.1 cytochrome c oxidase assembly protein [Methylobacterium sp. WL93]TXN53154.1 cytochrome c oxidase assembly protein [Methylobacterium sp. WL119]TXN70916.1 cytochrome c oxidase assembly protein [Methylobacterium sp. WL30]
MSTPNTDRTMLRTAFACGGMAVGMIGLAFASVPLYDAFCKATGYDGTPRQGPALTAGVATDDSMVVHFDTNVSSSLPWRFKAESRRVEAHLGETKTVFFQVKNTGTTPSTGVATFNVQPGLMGSYFVKIECFCFKEQTLQPGETLDVPVVFYIDPEVRKDSNTAHLSEMTLSYTYFASKNGEPVTAAVANTSTPGNKRDF